MDTRLGGREEEGRGGGGWWVCTQSTLVRCTVGIVSEGSVTYLLPTQVQMLTSTSKFHNRCYIFKQHYTSILVHTVTHWEFYRFLRFNRKMSKGKVRYQAGAEEVEMVGLSMLSLCSVSRDFRYIVMDMPLLMMVVCWYCIVISVELKEMVSRDYRYLLMDMFVRKTIVCCYCIMIKVEIKGMVSRDFKDEVLDSLSMPVVGYISVKTGKPDTTVADCLGCGGRAELWLQGVRFGYFNPDNAVAVVDGIGRSEQCLLKVEVQEKVSRDYNLFRMFVVGYFSVKTGKPDATGADCLGCGGRVKLWLQGVRCGYFNLNNAVAVVDGIVRMEKWAMDMGEKNLRGGGNNWAQMGIGFNPYTRGPEF